MGNLFIGNALEFVRRPPVYVFTEKNLFHEVKDDRSYMDSLFDMAVFIYTRTYKISYFKHRYNSNEGGISIPLFMYRLKRINHPSLKRIMKDHDNELKRSRNINKNDYRKRTIADIKIAEYKKKEERERRRDYIIFNSIK